MHYYNRLFITAALVSMSAASISATPVKIQSLQKPAIKRAPLTNQKKYSLKAEQGKVFCYSASTEKLKKNYLGFSVSCKPFSVMDREISFTASSRSPRSTESVFVRCLNRQGKVVACWYAWKPLKKKSVKFELVPKHTIRFKWMQGAGRAPETDLITKIEFLLQANGKGRSLGMTLDALEINKLRKIKKLDLAFAKKAQSRLTLSKLDRLNLFAYSKYGKRFTQNYRQIVCPRLGKAEKLFQSGKYAACRRELETRHLSPDKKIKPALLAEARLLYGDSLLIEQKFKEAAAAYTILDRCPVPEIRVQALLNRIYAQNLQRHFYYAFQLAEKLKQLPEAVEDPNVKLLGMLNIGYTMFYELNDYFHSTKNCGLLLRETAAPEEFRKICHDIFKEMKVKRDSRSPLSRGRPIALTTAAKISKKHPRLFFNQKTWPAIVENLKRPICKEYYLTNIKEPAVAASANPKIWNGETGLGKTADGTRKYLPKPSAWGIMAAKCAIVYLLEKDPIMLKKAISMLEVTGTALHQGIDKGVGADNYYNTETLYALCAYDWLYNELSPEQRRKIIKPLLEYVNRLEYDFVKIFCARSYPYSSGFYGVRMLLWYAGLAAVHDGIDDELALKFIYEGWIDHQILLEARDAMCGDDGGLYTPTNTYAMMAYIWSTFNFLHTWGSASGQNIAGKVNHLKYFPQWCAWNVINGHESVIGKGTSWEFKTSKLDFGNGDISNLTKNIPNIDMHMHEIMHLMHGDKSLKTIAESLCQKDTPLTDPYMLRFRPLIPLFLYHSVYARKKDLQPPQLKEHARLFENIGIAFMRSGSTPQDTYACFTTNKRDVAHRHYDANSFMIYKYDFLALDTGTRCNYMWEDYAHMNCYYAQTVAHNAILIHMPEEAMPRHWVKPKKPQKIYSHGGQMSTIGDRCIAFETNKLFTYVAGDATPVYSYQKCEEAIRQFVFVYPDYFVIADRVTSTRPEYRKEWLLHTQHQIHEGNNASWYSDNGKGRMFCRTLLPKKVKAKIVGGPGKRFMASGRNWPLPEKAKKYLESENYFGQYRLEVSPAEARRKDCFLHVIQVGKNTLPKMISTSLVEDDKTFGVEFETARGKWRIKFHRDGNIGGSVRLEKADKTIYQQKLKEKIQKQSGVIL